MYVHKNMVRFHHLYNYDSFGQLICLELYIFLGINNLYYTCACIHVLYYEYVDISPPTFVSSCIYNVHVHVYTCI